MTFFRFEPLEHVEEYKKFMNNWRNEYSSQSAVTPLFDIYTDEKGFYIEAEAAGLTKENIKLNLQENTLTITAEKKRENNEGKKYLKQERVFGSFKRSITFPEDVNADTVEAKYENGVLKIKVEKLIKPEFKERIININ